MYVILIKYLLPKYYIFVVYTITWKGQKVALFTIKSKLNGIIIYWIITLGSSHNTPGEKSEFLI